MLKAQGFATAEQKAEVSALLKEVDADGQEVVKDDVADVNALPAEDPKEGEELEKNIKTLLKKHVGEVSKEEFSKSFDALKPEIKSWLEKEQEAIKAKAGIYKPDVAEKRHGMNVYLRKFTRALLSNDVAELLKINNVATVKEMTTDSSGSPFGGYVTDHELSAEIRHLITEYGVARQEFMTVQLSKNRYEANTLATDVSVYWVDEGAGIKSTQAVLGQEELRLNKLGAICTLTRELLEDEEIDLFSFVASRVAEGFAQAEDTAFFVGDGPSDTGNGGFLGLLNNPNTNQSEMAAGDDAFTDLTADHLLSMQDDSPQWVARNGKYYMHRSIRNLVRKLKGTDGHYIYQDPTSNGPALLWGRPVVEVEVMPSVADSDAGVPFIIYGDLKKSSILGYKGAISADRFNAGVVRNVADNADINLITTDREAVRWIERVGAITILPKAATVLLTGSGS